MLTDRDLGYQAVLAALARVDDGATLVGIHEEEGAQVDATGGLSLASVGAVNEFGSDDGRVPERSFLRATVDANAAAYTERLTRITDDAAMGKRSLRDGLARLGALAEGDVKQFMTDLTDPPNAPSTIARKGSSNPLIDTGGLRAAIRHVEEGG